MRSMKMAVVAAALVAGAVTFAPSVRAEPIDPANSPLGDNIAAMLDQFDVPYTSRADMFKQAAGACLSLRGGTSRDVLVENLWDANPAWGAAGAAIFVTAATTYMCPGFDRSSDRPVTQKSPVHSGW